LESQGTGRKSPGTNEETILLALSWYNDSRESTEISTGCSSVLSKVDPAKLLVVDRDLEWIGKAFVEGRSMHNEIAKQTRDICMVIDGQVLYWSLVWCGRLTKAELHCAQKSLQYTHVIEYNITTQIAERVKVQ
jgi:hypothetical protein